MHIKTAGAPANKFLYFLFYFVAAIILFLPILNKHFVSDDYVVLKRVCLERTLRVEGFFRPLSDCTIYLNYLIGNLRSPGFNLLNIFIHSVNSFLLFQLCLKWKWSPDEKLQWRYALVASILFLTYPFHNEAVAWLLGRGSSLAATFGISALLILLSGWNDKVKYLGVCICYFIGLLAYESIIILPLIIFVLLIGNKTPTKTFLNWTLVFFITGIAHLILRYNFSGAIFGKYGEDFFDVPLVNFVGNTFKVIGRLIIPPISNPLLFLVILAFTAGAIFYLFFIKLKKQIPNRPFVFKLLGILGCTLIIPFLFAVSTRTSEGDRLLYTPSIFFCCLISFLLCSLVRSRIKATLIFVSLCIYNVLFLEVNNYNWLKAGEAANFIISTLKSDRTDEIFIANLPNEINGAYVFREGFKDALIINKIDTSKITVINKLSKELITDPDETWTPAVYQSKIFIPPLLEITRDTQTDTSYHEPGHISYVLPEGSNLYYWDQHKFVLLKKWSELLK